MILKSGVCSTIEKILFEYNITSEIVNKSHPTQSPVNELFVKLLNSYNYGD